MVYIRSWTEYQERAEKLFEEYPTKTRYCVKYRGSEGVLILKVTNDDTCLKFKTQSSIMLNRFDVFTLSMMTKMQNRRPKAAAIVTQSTPNDAPLPKAETEPGEAGGSGSGAAAKKKKPKKRK